MGSRHLVCVYANKRFQAAQYGHYDGYPGGVGVEVLEFVQSLATDNFKAFKKKLRNIRLLSSEEFNERDLHDKPEYKQPPSHEVLKTINESEKEIYLVNKASFGGDSLNCEWAYVLNFDNNTFEVYEGFVENESESAPLFMKYKLPPKQKSPENPLYVPTDYYPMKLVGSYGLETLPDLNDFVERFNEEED